MSSFLLDSRYASTCSKTIIFTDRAKNASSAPAESTSTIVSPDGQTRPANFFSQSHLTLETLFYLATLGGAQLCGLADRIGSFEVGKEFDALLIQTGQRDEESVETSAAEQEGLEMLALEEEVADAFPLVQGTAHSGGGFNPSLLVEPDEPIERVFEKFLFAVRALSLAVYH